MRRGEASHAIHQESQYGGKSISLVEQGSAVGCLALEHEMVNRNESEVGHKSPGLSNPDRPGRGKRAG